MARHTPRYINSKWKNSLLDMRVQRGADLRGDHQLLLMAMLTIKLCKTKIGEDKLRRIDATKLKVPETKASFQLELRNRFQALEEELVEPTLSSFHQTVREAGGENTGIQKKEERRMDTARNMGQDNRKKQMEEKINSARSERVKDLYRTKYQDLDKELKKMAKRDKKDYIENLAETHNVHPHRRQLHCWL